MQRKLSTYKAEDRRFAYLPGGAPESLAGGKGGAWTRTCLPVSCNRAKRSSRGTLAKPSLPLLIVCLPGAFLAPPCTVVAIDSHSFGTGQAMAQWLMH